MNKQKYILGFLPFAAALLFAIVWITTLLSAGTITAAYSIANAPTAAPTDPPTATAVFTPTAIPSDTPVPEAAVPTEGTAPTAGPTATIAAPTEKPQETVDIIGDPTNTPAPPTATATLAPSPTIDVQGTQQAEVGEMQAVISQLYSEGWIDTEAGEHYTLPNYEDAWATTDPAYRVKYTDFSPADFVVRADAFWQTSNSPGTTQRSGCGFLFREESEGNHILIFMGMDGRVHMRRYLGGNELDDVQSVLVPVDYPEGSGEIMLAVSGSKVTFFVDGVPWFDPQNNYLTFGNLGLATVTGTSVGLGTYCRMENVQLWVAESE